MIWRFLRFIETLSSNKLLVKINRSTFIEDNWWFTLSQIHSKLFTKINVRREYSLGIKELFRAFKALNDKSHGS